MEVYNKSMVYIWYDSKIGLVMNVIYTNSISMVIDGR